jgi:alpha-mannosidase
MLPSEINFDDVNFRLPTAKMGSPDAIVAKGQTIKLPAGNFSRVYILAASNDGDQKATFDVGGKPVELNIQDWGGFIGQWDDRQWTSIDSEHDHYGEMTRLKPGYIKRGDLAWYCSHHHNQAGENIPYAYSYLFAYELQLPQSAQSIKLPNNQKVLILAISAAELNPKLEPIQPLYDTLPLPALETR